MKLEVGMHAYSKKCRDYGIGKIVNITEGGLGFKGDLIDIQYRHSKHAIENHDVIASFNIIDLIEAGDYVNGYYVSKIWEKDEITHYVDGTPIKRKEREIVIQAPSYGGIEILKNKNIKSIVTKEQFGNVSYKIEV